MIHITLYPVRDDPSDPKKELVFKKTRENSMMQRSSIVAREFRNGEWIEIEFTIGIGVFHPESVQSALELIIK